MGLTFALILHRIVQKKELIFCCAITVLGALLAFYRIGDHGLWYDEIASVVTAGEWRAMWVAMVRNDPNMWLYLLSLHFWMKLGSSEALIRSFSALCAVGSLPLFFTIAKLMGAATRMALGAMLLMAVNPFFIRYAQEARSYSLLLLLTLGSILFFLKALQDQRFRYWLLCAALLALAVYTHFFAGLMIVVYGFIFYRWRRTSFPLWHWLAGVGIFILLLLPLVVWGNLGSGQVDYLRRPGFKDIYNLFLAFCGGNRTVLLPYLLLCSTAALMLVYGSVCKNPSDKTATKLFPLVWLLLPVTCAYLFSVLVKPLFQARFLIICLPAMILLAVSALRLVRNRWLWLFMLGGLSLVSIRATTQWYDRDAEDWPGVVSFVTHNAAAGDAVTFFIYPERHCFEYYSAKTQTPDSLLALVNLVSLQQPPSFVGGRLADPDPAILSGLCQNQKRVWLILGQANGQELGYRTQVQGIVACLQNSFGKPEERTFINIRVLLFKRGDGKPAVVSEECRAQSAVPRLRSM